MAGALFLELPGRWLASPTWRCANGHVSYRFLKAEMEGDICLECMTPVWLTFPEDVDGGELGAEVLALRRSQDAISEPNDVGITISSTTDLDGDSTVRGNP